MTDRDLQREKRSHATRGSRWAPFDQRFDNYVDRGDGSGCWEWRGPRMGEGYGEINRGSKVLLAHRVSYQRFVGEIPDGMRVCHHCDNPGCVRPDHLFVGTQGDNMRDMARKGRGGTGGARGSENRNAKLTEEIVREMRSEERLGDENDLDFHRRLAGKYGVGRTCVHGIMKGNTWRHVQ